MHGLLGWTWRTSSLVEFLLLIPFRYSHCLNVHTHRFTWPHLCYLSAPRSNFDCNWFGNGVKNLAYKYIKLALWHLNFVIFTQIYYCHVESWIVIILAVCQRGRLLSSSVRYYFMLKDLLVTFNLIYLLAGGKHEALLVFDHEIKSKFKKYTQLSIWAYMSLKGKVCMLWIRFLKEFGKSCHQLTRYWPKFVNILNNNFRCKLG